jgi:hypothetical protein
VKLLAAIVSLSILIGCASSSPPQSISLAESLGSASCASGEFRGSGIGKSEDEALNIARSDLAMQINSSLKVSTKYRQSQQVFNGNENLSSEYESNLVVEANLLNAHDARVLRVEQRIGEAGAVVCMTKADAAKGFLERQRLMMDSLGLASNTASSAEHPRRKNEAWRKTQMLHNDFMRIQNLFEGWGVTSPYSADEIYSNAREDYKNYCKGVKVFWQDAGNECSNTVFSILSKKIKIEKSRCSDGLNLSFNCSEKCKSSSYGIECSYEPSLAIESCGGEKYSMLKAKAPVTGSDMYNEAKAREKLVENLPKTAFFNEWEKEIKEWVPQCAD